MVSGEFWFNLTGKLSSMLHLAAFRSNRRPAGPVGVFLLVRYFWLVGVSTTVAGCAHHPGNQPPTTASAITAAPTPRARRPPGARARTIEPPPKASEQLVGRVKVIGAHGSFVLIEAPSALVTAAVPAGYLLRCHPFGTPSGAVTADLRVSPERRSPFLVADVISGSPSVGDAAYLTAEGSAPSVPPTTPVIPYSSVLPIPSAALPALTP